MGFRRKKSDVTRQRQWKNFLTSNQIIIEQAGLPETVTETLDRFLDFLMHGYIDHHDDPEKFTVNHLDDNEYGELMELLNRFCTAGFIEQEELQRFLYHLQRHNP